MVENRFASMGVARIFLWAEHFFKFVKIFKNIQKIQKNLLRKLLKMVFSIFFEKFNKPSIEFLRVWRKNAISRIFLENFQIVLKIIAKNALF